jgi:hypothetical protein
VSKIQESAAGREDEEDIETRIPCSLEGNFREALKMICTTSPSTKYIHLGIHDIPREFFLIDWEILYSVLYTNAINAFCLLIHLVHEIYLHFILMLHHGLLWVLIF